MQHVHPIISWTKQKTAASKELATAIEQNLHTSLLTQHTQLRSKLTKTEYIELYMLTAT